MRGLHKAGDQDLQYVGDTYHIKHKFKCMHIYNIFLSTKNDVHACVYVQNKFTRMSIYMKTLRQPRTRLVCFTRQNQKPKRIDKREKSSLIAPTP